MNCKIITRQTKRGDWMVQEELQRPDGTWHFGRQLARFSDENEALGYADEVRYYQSKIDANIKAYLTSQPPAMTSKTDPFDHPAFWMIEEASESEYHHLGFAAQVIREVLSPEQLSRPDWHRLWAGTEVIVDEGYGSPYQFGRLLRQMVNDDAAVIFRYNPTGIYFSMSNNTGKAAYYDPSKREGGPEIQFGGEIDWFVAVDHLAAPPDDLITQAQAAARHNISTSAVSNAIRDSRLRGYRQGDAVAHRPGGVMVSQADTDLVWGPSMGNRHE